MKDYTWNTDEAHFNNSDTLQDYLACEMDAKWTVLDCQGTEALIMTDKGGIYSVQASGDGDSFNHIVTFAEV